jgi:hypothetical protein
MAISAEQINEMANQIRGTTDCDAIKLVVEEHMQGLKKLVKSVVKTQLDQLKKNLPPLSIPGPNPIKIVKWIKKSVIGQALPQLEAYIQYAQDLIKIAQAISNLAGAIGDAAETIQRCATELVDDTINGVVNTVNSEIDDALNTTLGSIAGVQVSIGGVLGAVSTPIDTSSPKAFTATVDAGLASIQNDSAKVMNAPQVVLVKAPTITGTAQVEQKLTVDNGTWKGDPNEFTYQWIRVGADTKSEIIGATTNEYTVKEADVGNTLVCKIVASNPGDAEEAESTATATVIALPPEVPAV